MENRPVIVSFSKNFLLIKTRKTAGTSVELALSPFLAAGDVATPINPKEEETRNAGEGVLIGRPARLGISLRDHSPLWRARFVYGRRIDDMRIVTIARNPWDRAVSQFFWTMRRTDMRARDFGDQRAAFAKYTRTYGPRGPLDWVYGRKRQRALSNHHMYSRNGENQAAFVIFFERLEEDLARLGAGLGLEGRPVPPNAKSGIRPKTARRWQEYYDDDLRDFVARHCRREIEDYGYDFAGEAAPEYRKSLW
ncbi:hypothetical protein [Shimia aestuarii]|uniref:Sulfotransferase family protein n=1 Tax=Shimia aestuarii TaxID=254406 RepID=A0A1I4K2R2_9RHOB|nr:hypothetical protein [Shimia aestuarii]SFL72911.1 hypothetical protein SAMN04488042_1011284 [Shimia aestuarii]